MAQIAILKIASLVVLLALHTLSARSLVVDVGIVIVGGGPGGLATALAIRRSAPAETTIAVFERDELLPKGASVAISQSGWQALRAVDPEAEQRVRGTGTPVVDVGFASLSGDDGPGPAVRAGLAAVNLVTRARRKVVKVLRGEERGGEVGMMNTHLWHDVRSVLAERVLEVCGEGALCTGRELVAFREPSPAGDSPAGDAGQQRHRFELDFSCAGASEVMTVRAGCVLACDGVGSTVRRLAPKEPKANEVFLSEGRSVWRGVAPGSECHGKATFYRSSRSSGNSGGGGADASAGAGPDTLAAASSALVFPAGRAGGASWTVIAPAMPGRAGNSDDARRRCLAALESAARREGTGSDGGSDGGEPGGRFSRLPALLEAAIRGSPAVVEHRLAVRNFGEGVPYGSQTAGLAFVGDAQHPVRPTGEGLALAWADAAEIRRAFADATAAAAGAAYPAVGVREGEPAVHSQGELPVPPLSPEAMAGALRAYEAARLPVVRGVSERVRAAAEAFYK